MNIIFDIFLFISLIIMGAGYAVKTRKNHLLRIVGWLGFGIYWFLQTPHFLAIDDAVNALGCSLTLPLSIFIGYHEYLSYIWNEEYEPLRFVTGATFAAVFLYFIVERIPILSASLIYIVALQSVWLLNLFGLNFYLGNIDYAGNNIWYMTHFDPNYVINVPVFYDGINLPIVRIIFACTALIAMLAVGSFVFGTKAKPNKKWKAFLILVPPTYVINLIRNAVVIYLVGIAHWDFDFAHNYIGKSISLAALIILVLLAFHILPELYENLNGLFDLPWRRTPNHDYKKYVGRLYKKNGTSK